MFLVTNEFSQFKHQTGILRSFLRFTELDIEPSSFTGAFDPHRTQELIRFCQEHTDYHIVSLRLDGSYLNGYSPNGALFYLANGDRNPRLAYNPRGYIDIHDLSV